MIITYKKELKFNRNLIDRFFKNIQSSNFGFLILISTTANLFYYPHV